MRWLESSFRGKARAWVGFNEPFSHKLTAAADILLMPSRFEPCGLNQVRGVEPTKVWNTCGQKGVGKSVEREVHEDCEFGTPWHIRAALQDISAGNTASVHSVSGSAPDHHTFPHLPHSCTRCGTAPSP